jgi:hypothetical protein
MMDAANTIGRGQRALIMRPWCVVTKQSDSDLLHAAHLQRVQVPSR